MMEDELVGLTGRVDVAQWMDSVVMRASMGEAWILTCPDTTFERGRRETTGRRRSRPSQQSASSAGKEEDATTGTNNLRTETQRDTMTIHRDIREEFASASHCMRDICVYVRGHIRCALPQGGVGYMIRQEGASLLHSQP